MENALDIAWSWHQRGQRIALATVVETWGSAPRPAGSVMACNEAGEFAGSVSGGCVEVAVIEAALEVIRGGPPRVLEFGVGDELAWSVGLACGGRIRVYVGTPDPAVLQSLLASRAGSTAVALATALGGHDVRVIVPGPQASSSPLQTAARQSLRTDAAQRVTVDGEEWLITPHNPPLRLIVVGAVHIAESLCAVARLAEHAVTVIDPRSAFLRPDRFPGVALDGRWPQEALSALEVDARCAAVLLTHDPKIDDPALHVLIRSPVYYLGALGSRRTHGARLERLASAGFSPAETARIRGPAGLPIGARTPAEIALSVMAEITAALRAPEKAA